MKPFPIMLALVAGLAAPNLASAQASQIVHDEQVLALAKADHDIALKTHNQKYIPITEARVRAADEALYYDRKDAALAAAPPATGETRAAEEELIHAKEAHQHALIYGDPAEIARTETALKLAYEHDYAVRHPK
jgi:hypothetical protein